MVRKPRFSVAGASPGSDLCIGMPRCFQFSVSEDLQRALHSSPPRGGTLGVGKFVFWNLHGNNEKVVQTKSEKSSSWCAEESL